MSHTTTPVTRAAGPHPSQTRALAAAVAVVVALHSLILGGLGQLGAALTARHPAPLPDPVLAPLQVRQILLAAQQRELPGPAPSATMAANSPATPPAPTQLPYEPIQLAPQPTRQPVPTEVAAQVAVDKAIVARPGPGHSSSAEATLVPAAPQHAARQDAALEGPQDAAAAPLYTTQPAPAATLHYELHRGPVQGLAHLRWQPMDNRYQLQIQFQTLGAAFAGWASSGQFDSHGLAPARYSELRRGREVRATNFQRDAQTLSFSAQSAAWPLPSGIQDRSSWMLQLAAVLQANPQLAEIGSQVTLTVVGTRGRPEPWTFTVLGHGNLDTPAGPVADAVQLLREPRRPYDTRATVWLDPARHHLPVQLHLDVHGTNEGQRWRLLQLQWD